jgi:hypothetical protein
MHDTDRTLAELASLEAEGESEFEMEDEFEGEDLENPAAFEFEAETGYETSPVFEGEGEAEDEFGAGEYEAEGEFEDEGEFAGEGEYEGEGEFASGEMSETELAAELLEIQSEDELEYFLGGLLSAAAKKVGAALAGSEGQKLIGLLKGAAKKVLPAAGAAIGGFFGGPAGMALGGNIAAQAGKAFGLELEGLAPEDREFETAKAFVRFATDAAQQATHLATEMEGEAAVRQAYLRAARRFAPGLLRGDPLSLASGTRGGGCGCHGGGRRATGRWTRVGRNQLVLYGL